MSGFLIKKEKV